MAEHTRRRNGLSADAGWKKWVAIIGVVGVVIAVISALGVVFNVSFQTGVNAQGLVDIKATHEKDKKEEREARQLVQRAQWDAIGKVGDAVHAQAVAAERTATALEGMNDKIDRMDRNR